MWIFTPEGFYSIVAERGGRRLVVRSRDYDDLVRLTRLVGTKADISIGEGTDYPFRVRLTRRQARRLMRRSVDAITYTNFKDEVKARQGYERASIYMRVWTAMLSLEPRWWARRWSGDDGYDHEAMHAEAKAGGHWFDPGLDDQPLEPLFPWHEDWPADKPAKST